MRLWRWLVPESAQVSPGSLRSDMVAGVTVAVVALPLALGFGISSGLGAAAGMTSAVVAGFVAALCGGSRFQVSGPTGAMTVVLIPIAHRVGVAGVLAVGLLAGLLMMAAGVLRLGGLVRLLPTSLIEGFTGGIAVVIALQQVPQALASSGAGHEKVLPRALAAINEFVAAPQVGPAVVAMSVLVFLLALTPRFGHWPLSLVAVVAATACVSAASWDVPLIGDLPATLGRPSVGFLRELSLHELIAPAVSVALLAILESLLSATVADRMRGSGPAHRPNRELVGQGLANLVTPFFGGVPATAALARTAVNVRSGAQTRRAAMFHALVLAAVVLAAGSLVARIPLAALAGVLVATSAHMIKPREMLRLMRSDWVDAAVLATTFVLTVLVDLITAVAVGVAITVLLVRVRVGRAVPPTDDDETLGD